MIGYELDLLNGNILEVLILNIRNLNFLAMILFAFLASSSWPAAGQFPSMTDLTVASVKEEYGKWMVEFNWSDMDEYDRSVAHGDSTSGRTAIHTDALSLASSSDRSKAIKVSVITYSQSDPSHVNASSMAALANSTLTKSGVCQDISITERLIEGRKGVSASGQKCPTGEMVYVAVYPVLYHLDRPGGVLASDAVGLIQSTYDPEVTERFLNSVKIIQIK